MIGTHVNPLLHPDDVNVARDKRSQVLNSNASYYVNSYRLRHTDGSYIWAEVTRHNHARRAPVNRWK
ncbi:MAG: PAS domain-containing protein [Chloroflexi bacterium]|nr:PAS domain-containing protein [Chloroflexota bacterium]